MRSTSREALELTGSTYSFSCLIEQKCKNIYWCLKATQQPKLRHVQMRSTFGASRALFSGEKTQ